jgi:Svf1-like N-terminal lipocalin domain
LANVAGTQEPEYGPSAIQSVAAQAKSVPFTELSKEDLRWKAMESTCVETQTFYFMSDDGVIAMAQVIYSNVGSDLGHDLPLLSFLYQC